MWKHRIIEDLIGMKESYLEFPTWIENSRVYETTPDEAFDEILGYLKESICFHIDKYIDKNCMIHRPEEFIKYMSRKMPYHTTLITIDSTTSDEVHSGALLVVERSFDERKTALFVMFDKFKYEIEKTIKEKWSISFITHLNEKAPLMPVINFICLDVDNEKIINLYKEASNKLGRLITPSSFYRLQAYSIYDTLTKLLSCKNISTQEILPSEKLNKKRIRNGKLPVYSYKVLTYNPNALTKKYKSDNMTDPKYHVRLHFCRGHIKTYTEEKKLLGKHTGSFWWEPAMRGQNKDGFVD